MLHVHHQKGTLNHRFGGEGQLGHQATSPKPALALPKRAFNGHPRAGIVMALLVGLLEVLGGVVGHLPRRPQGWP